MLKAALAVVALLLTTSVSRAGREFSIDLWDWTAPCADLGEFSKWAESAKAIGVTRLEISAPWNRLEPERGKYDLSYIGDRLEIAKAHGLGLRVRISTFYSGATPAWFKGAHLLDVNGKLPLGSWVIPSVNDPALWDAFGPLCTQIARRFKGEDIYLNPFIGMHAELKWSDWWTYDEASLKIWREAIAANPRPTWLARIVGDAPLPDVPPVPGPTDGVPDTNPATMAHVAFREHTYREALAQFVKYIRTGDPSAKISVPLGESYRKESAVIANLDYWGLSRGADQVVHSYDFFWHHKDPSWQAGASVAAFRGITGKPVQFEFDGPFLFSDLKYTTESVVELAREAVAQGAGIKAANYSGSGKLPAEWPALVELGKLTSAAGEHVDRPAAETTLLFVSKWANYAYREKTQWLHEAQFGAWKMLTDKGIPVRIICEDNLEETGLGKYRSLYVAFSPPELMPWEDRERLARLAGELPSVIELAAVPAKGFFKDGAVPLVLKQGDNRVTLGYPLAYHHFRDANAVRQAVGEVVRILAPSRSTN